MSSRIIKLLEENKREHNQGPIAPITREKVKKAGSLRKYYEKEARYDPFAQRVAIRLMKVSPRRGYRKGV